VLQEDKSLREIKVVVKSRDRRKQKDFELGKKS
jgi:hypothetical protein